MAKTATAKRTQKQAEPQAAAWSHGNFYWNELRTRDAERAKRFYEDTIGWSFERHADGRRRDLLGRNAGRQAGRRPVSR